jgi:uridine kinase
LDDYTEDAIYPPTLDWLKNGSNPDEFITPQFVANLKALRDGRSIIHPESKAKIFPAEYIILEEPFGRSRTVMKDLIDYHVQVQIPPELALARRVLRNINRLEDNGYGEGLKEFLEWYIRAGRDFFAAVREQASKDVDLVVNGELPTDILAQKIFETIRARQIS